jgi:hypothetical protein
MGVHTLREREIMAPPRDVPLPLPTPLGPGCDGTGEKSIVNTLGPALPRLP